MKKFLIPIFILILFTPLFLFSQEIEYPEIPPGAATPTATTTFPAYVKYLFNFVIMISGLIALGVMIWGGILYLTSAGDPTQMSEARNKIFGALLGLIIILSSYLILYTINPQLTFLTLQPVGPTSGVYLIDTKNEKIHIGDNKTKLSLKNDIKEIEFISPTSSLLAIYLYPQEDLKGNEERRINLGAGTTTTSPFTKPKSISLLWNRPGVYLCPGVPGVLDVLPSGETICPKRPLYTAVSIPDLSKHKFGDGTYDNITKSIQIIQSEIYNKYRALLFEKPNYLSDNRCPLVFESISNLDDTPPISTNNRPPLGQNKLSSLIITTFDPDKQISGTVTFYDKTDCLPGAKSHEVTIPESIEGGRFGTFSLDKQVRSFRISGPGGVLLVTKGIFFDVQDNGKCRFFTRADPGFDITGCLGQLPTEICDPISSQDRPSGFIIMALPE